MNEIVRKDLVSAAYISVSGNHTTENSDCVAIAQYNGRLVTSAGVIADGISGSSEDQRFHTGRMFARIIVDTFLAEINRHEDIQRTIANIAVPGYKSMLPIEQIALSAISRSLTAATRDFNKNPRNPQRGLQSGSTLLAYLRSSSGLTLMQSGDGDIILRKIDGTLFDAFTQHERDTTTFLRNIHTHLNPAKIAIATIPISYLQDLTHVILMCDGITENGFSLDHFSSLINWHHQPIDITQAIINLTSPLPNEQLVDDRTVLVQQLLNRPPRINND